MGDEDPKYVASLNLMRRMPPATTENSLLGLLELEPDLTEDLLQSIDQPLKVKKDTKTGRSFLLSDYNRDGDSWRSPWSNEYFPAVEEEEPFLPSDRLREMEVQANELYAIYKKLYFESGESSVYFFDTQEDEKYEGFGATFLIHKDVKPKGSLASGFWDSTHVFDVSPASGGKFKYSVATTVMISMIMKDKNVGNVNLSGSITDEKEYVIDPTKNDKGHVAVMGEIIEKLESVARNYIQEIYIQKTRQVIDGMRTTSGNYTEDQWKGIAASLKENANK